MSKIGNAQIKLYNVSDSRFIIRLILSWVLHFTYWITLIVGMCVATVLGIYVVGYITNRIFFSAENDVILVFAIGLIALVVYIVIFGLGVCVIELIKEDYKNWLKTQHKENQKPEVKQTVNDVAIDFSELDFEIEGQEKYILDTIPEILMFRNFMRTINENINALLRPASLQLYIYEATKVFITYVIYVLVGLLGSYIIGDYFVPPIMYTDKKIVVPDLIRKFLCALLGAFIAGILGGIYTIIKFAIIDDCIKEWNLHKKRASYIKKHD